MRRIREGNFWRDSLNSMNRDMEKKGIVLRELRCRTAAELPAPELPDCRRSFSGSPAALAVYCGVLRALNYRQSFPASPAGVLRELNSLSGVDGGSPAAQLQEYNPFLLLVPSSGLPAKLRQSSSYGGAAGSEMDCTPGAELPPSSPHWSCSSAGPQNLSHALIGGEWGSRR